MLKTKFAIVLILLIWNLGNFIEFYIHLADFLLFFHLFFNHLFSFVCHQDAEKLISFWGKSTLLCTRCSGIYFGAFLFSIVNIFTKQAKSIKTKLLFFSAIPLIFDVTFTSFGIYNYSKIIAFSTGIVLGFVGLQFLISTIFTFSDNGE